MSTDEGGLDLSRVLRGLFLAVGLAVFGVGLLAVFVPEVERALGLEAVIESLGSDYLVVAVIGIAAVAVAALVLGARRLHGVDEAIPPTVEVVQSASYPGESFDHTTVLSRFLSARTDRRDRLKEAAIRSFMRSEGCTRGSAERRVAEGEWTDDPVAARYLAGPSRGRVGGSFTAGLRADRTAQRTVDAIARLNDEGGRAKRRDRRGGEKR